MTDVTSHLAVGSVRDDRRDIIFSAGIGDQRDITFISEGRPT